jgi:pimeloyl-ACP methyl ester carboxylesterase
MSASQKMLRLVALLLILAGVLLLRLPVFGQAIIAAPTRFSVVIEGVAAGKGPEVILIPGLASSRDDYAAEAKLLVSNYRLHLIQIAGFAGESAGPNATGPILVPVVEQLHQYIASNHLQHPAVIGHSLGGLVGLMLARSHPEDVGKLLVVDSLPFYGLLFAPNATVDLVRPKGESMHDMLLKMPDDQFAATQPLMASRLVHSPEGQKIVAASSIASDRTVFANAMLEDLTTDMRGELASIKTPTTVLYPYTSSEGSEAEVTALYTSAYATMPNVHLIRIDDSLHFIMFDQPAAFDKAVQAFLKA